MLLIELITALVWFNPFIWLIKKDIQLIHEYLADEGVLCNGVNKYAYQTLLINQVAEEQLIGIASNFNHSLIKKRIMMMTNKNQPKSKRSLVGLIFISALLFLAISCVNQEKSANKNNFVSSVSALKMNVMYLGVDNPIKVAISGYDNKDLNVTVDNGKIKGSDGDYVVKPTKKGLLKVTTSSKGKKIVDTEFRVKRIPDPTTFIHIGSENYDRFALISMKNFLNSGINKLGTNIESFDFDLTVKIESFKVSYLQGKDTVCEQTIRNDSFSFKDLKKFTPERGKKIYIEEILVRFPDNTERKLMPIILEID